ncbi:hypothetical protein DdX_14072 [Ditylenchus destructor]|uniref:Uncharacterized protein n=1 Tax=Ditylenchus destructor TaxID=166010 RepID=A0AAD4MSU1_9BILA|nr:hypothetical protein DdX_14072 [Ditylenchus destructor]
MSQEKRVKPWNEDEWCLLAHTCSEPTTQLRSVSFAGLVLRIAHKNITPRRVYPTVCGSDTHFPFSTSSKSGRRNFAGRLPGMRSNALFGSPGPTEPGLRSKKGLGRVKFLTGKEDTT